MSLAAGTFLGPYEIRGLVGAGGMGEVYRARDARLDRDVAIKILPAGSLENPRRRALFEQEVAAVGRLNHPNVLAVHDTGEHQGSPYLVTELLEGETLAQRIAQGVLPPRRALEYGLQIAHGLAAAHDRGIIHRDLKPANVFLTKDGRVKILDFGLAKRAVDDIAETAPSLNPADAASKAESIAGTVGYMAPEQLNGRPVDGRTDIFALGAVLYEMLAGRRAFLGRSTAETIMAALTSDPPDLRQVRPDLPIAIDRIVARCLEKRPEDRFQSATDVAFAIEAIASLAGSTSATLRPLGHLRFRLRWPRRPTVVAFASGLGAAALIWFGWTMRPSPPPLPDWVPRQLTSDPGWEGDPALSPDGQFVAYASDRGGNTDIWMMDTTGGRPVRLTDDPAVDRSPAWFPDGAHLVFVSNRGGSEGIWKVPRLGGSAVLLLANARSPAVSPDGQRLAFAQVDGTGMLRIAVGELADLSRVRVLTGNADGFWSHDEPAWSPDGRRLCYVARGNVWITDLEGGRPKPLFSERWICAHPVWSTDGRRIYFESDRGDTRALWRIPSAGGEPERVSLGTGPETQPSLSRDGRRLAYSTVNTNPSIAILDRRTGFVATRPQSRSEEMPAFSPDGRRLAFCSDREGRFDLWAQDIEEGKPHGEPKRLTDGVGAKALPVYSPDGRWIAYWGDKHMWVLAAIGGAARRLTEDPAVDLQPAWSPDGRRIVFVSDRSGSRHLWVTAFANGSAVGAPSRVTSDDAPEVLPAWSPDGATIAFLRPTGEAEDVWFVPASGARPARRVTEGAGALFIRWDRSSGALLVAGTWGGGRVALRAVDPTTREVRPAEPHVDFGDGTTYGDFDVSTDGRFIAYSRRQRSGDVWLLTLRRGAF
jgi:Tol biopolymer transport system component/serine/threonine protein kinase